MYECKVVLDSIAPSGRRLTTLALTYPRIVHSEVLTHRDRARNSASSRAIPWPKMMARIQDDPFIPLQWLSEQPGMVAGGQIANPELAEEEWLLGRDDAVRHAKRLAELGVHKSICNRVTEPWMWITVVMTATEWANFFRLRCHPDAEIHIQKIAYMARDAMAASEPRVVPVGSWHLPYVTESPDEMELLDWAKRIDVDSKGVRSFEEALCQISTARCARVSYMTHEGTRSPEKDLELYSKLVQGSGFGHWSPMEHPAEAAASGFCTSGPFKGWIQYRKKFPQECA